MYYWLACDFTIWTDRLDSSLYDYSKAIFPNIVVYKMRENAVRRLTETRKVLVTSVTTDSDDVFYIIVIIWSFRDIIVFVPFNNNMMFAY